MSTTARPQSSSTKSSPKVSRTRTTTSASVAPVQASSALDIDSPDFDSDAFFNHLTSSQTPGGLLTKHNEISQAARELSSERQSLVYNHHHELIDTSDIIRKIRDQTESLETSFDALRASFESICQITTVLSLPRQTSSKDENALDTDEQPHFDPLVHLPAILNIPTLLHAEVRQNADLIWGRWEPTLRGWEEAGVGGMTELISRCREILAEKRMSGGERARASSNAALT